MNLWLVFLTTYSVACVSFLIGAAWVSRPLEPNPNYLDDETDLSEAA